MFCRCLSESVLNEDVINLMNKESIYVSNLKDYPDTSYYKVKNLKAINTSFAEYSPAYSNGKLYFVSNRLTEKIYKTLRFNFSSVDEKLSKGKRLNTDVWYDEKTLNWVKASFNKKGKYF